MDKIRVSKVEDVTLWRRGARYEGTLHLTSHHLIFSYVPQATGQALSAKPKPRELWITYPMISFCTYRPTPPASHVQPSIRLRCRDFMFVAFHFTTEPKARDVYDTIRNLTCKLGRLEKLYAFSYQAQGPEKDVNGWSVYDPMKEYRRQGVGVRPGCQAWRVTEINHDYQYSPTYPAVFVVPTTISDNVLNYAGRYRSRVRIPVLTYLHPVNNCSISRSSQPMVGVRGARSRQDESLVLAIFNTSKPRSDNDEAPEDGLSRRTSNTAETPRMSMEDSFQETQNVEDEAIASFSQAWSSDGNEEGKVQPYGAQQNNLIVDARPTVNAYAMQAVGMGTENMDNYRFATKAYLGIDNIHVMRDSLNKVIDTLKDSDVTPLPPNREQLAKSGWLKHIANMLDGTSLIARQVGIHHSHVLIHCSDGWDRTSQLSALSQLCLDPYYRTMEGFIVLVEKDWLSFGHRFRYRSGLMGSEKWFEVENERIGGTRTGDSPLSKRTGGNAFGSAFKGFFGKHSNDSQESLVDVDNEVLAVDAPKSSAPDDSLLTKVKETSPIFHQFLDAVYQLTYQHPTRFEFNERFLRRLLYHLYSCQYGTFLYDNEKSRVDARVSEHSRSVWDYFLSRREQFTNELYNATIDDNVRGQERLIFPRTDRVRWWAELFGRTDEEMNGPEQAAYRPSAAEATSLTGVETADRSTGVSSTEPSPEFQLGNGNNGAAAIAAGLANLGVRTPSKVSSLNRPSRSTGRKEMEVEL